MMLIGKEVQLPAVEVVLVRCLTPGCGKRETELVNVDIGIPAAAAWFGLSCLRFTRIYIRTLKQATGISLAQDLISNSLYCLPYNSCDISFENVVLD